MNNKYTNIYNNLIKLTRNKSLFKKLVNIETFSDRLIVFLFHFAFLLKEYKDINSKEELQKLYDFVDEIRFDRLGVFSYSNEEGTYGSNAFKDDIPQQVKYDRMDAIMLLQQDISLEKNKKLIGNIERVIIDKYLDEGSSIGRTYRDSPDVDNTVIIDGHHPIGNFLDVKITDVTEYELQASPIK